MCFAVNLKCIIKKIATKQRVILNNKKYVNITTIQSFECYIHVRVVSLIAPEHSDYRKKLQARVTMELPARDLNFLLLC